ncbi:MAG: DNA polymerase/3'-5' exonuclease PolX [Bacteroidetes bacterium]|nr:DNA polymerase/3'-5' exonuclease PolX [Bacteroidota bacterium]
MTNKEISSVFSLLAKLMDLHGENSFKSKSYANAAFQIDKLPLQLSELPHDHIQFEKGIGESTAKKIIELLQSGELGVLNDLIKKTPFGILELMKIKGIGPKKIATIWHELGIESPGELLYACEENRLVNYKGFGEKSQQSIQEAIEFYLSNQGSFLYAQIEPTAYEILQALKILFNEDDICLSGDFAMHTDSLEQLEYVVPKTIEQIKQVLSVQNSFEYIEEARQHLIYQYHSACKIKFYSCAKADLTKTVFQTSSSEEFYINFLQQYPKALSEAQTEEAIFSHAQIQYIPPFLREQKEIIELAKQSKIPKLIETSDIKGIIHNHSTWSDGKFSIADMAKACIEKGFEYLVMSDHSVSSFYANGLSVERIKLQQEEIDKLNEKLHPFKIFKSIECDILGDGSLDYNDKVLATFDLVITSVHQNLKMTEEKAMSRLLGAITNPYTRILGHPTGRLLLSRKGYPIDHTLIIDACKAHDVVIEINANPRRLDMDWRWIQYAVEQGVLLSINPDAHSIAGIDDIRYGVLAAQKGMLMASQNLSSFSLQEFEAFLLNKKKP